MNYLLDTCTLLRLGMGGGDLGAKTRKRICVAAQLFYSSISLWEIARLQKGGKLVLPNTPEQFIADLVDRMIIAFALIHDLIVATGDGKFAQYGVRTVC